MSEVAGAPGIDIAGWVDLAKAPGRLDASLRAGLAAPGAAGAAFEAAGAVVQDGRVALDILLIDGVDAGAALAGLTARGMTGVEVDGRAASGWIATEDVGALETTDIVAFARATFGSGQVGSVGDEGSLAINAEAGRTDFGVGGAGVAVGVLSDSFDAWGGAAADRASGDLPDVTALQDAGGIDEGRAMLQIVHDVAPAAELLFHTANGGQAAFARGIRDLAAAGADVIVDDIVYLAEPFFQDGLVARAVDDVFADGVAYFSSAGNAASESYEAAFAGSGVDLVLQGQSGPVDFGEMHDFDPGAGVDVRQRISIPQGRDLFISFQWDQPFASISSGGRASASDLDIMLFGADGALASTNLFALSAAYNIGGDPVEVFRFVNNTATTEFDLVISHYAGPEAGLLKYVDLGGATIVEHATHSSTSYGHAPAAGGMGVGAAFWGHTTLGGLATPLLEGFSSTGPATILFDDDGRRLAEPELRQSPDVVGPDGVNTTFFGFDIGLDADLAPNFFGTSAAAPHVAAVAALMLELDPSLTPAEVYATLEATAIDMATAGRDDATGYGLVDASAALAAVQGAAPPAVDRVGAPLRLTGGGGDDLLIGDVRGDVLRGMDGDDRLDGGAGGDRLYGGLGDDVYIVDDIRDRIIDDGGVDRVVASIDYSLASGLENLTLTGSARIGSGNGLDNRLIGSTGDDLLKGGGGGDAIEGGAGDDVLRGHGGVDSLFGGLGADLLIGDQGADAMAGGFGDDIYIVDDMGDRIVESARGGHDEARASVDFSLDAAVEDLLLLGGGDLDGDGNGADNRLTGNDGANVLRGGAGDDAVDGGAGDDVLIGHGGDDVLTGGAGDDLILGREDADLLIGGAGADRMIGGAGADIFQIFRGDGVDRIDDFAVGEDRLQALGFGFADGAEVLALAQSVGASVRLSFGDGDQTLLLGVALDDLSAADFLT